MSKEEYPSLSTLDSKSLALALKRLNRTPEEQAELDKFNEELGQSMCDTLNENVLKDTPTS